MPHEIGEQGKMAKLFELPTLLIKYCDISDPGKKKALAAEIERRCNILLGRLEKEGCHGRQEGQN
ncbi:MAG TPA: hypothetical protein VH207_01270 [Chthoniobacterales bacterium]|jgi:hypothetical protein|nr:hypothetical protein [Chthoniobacterales bacterium]